MKHATSALATANQANHWFHQQYEYFFFFADLETTESMDGFCVGGQVYSNPQLRYTWERGTRK
jgi:hypothetical protein